MNKNYKLSKIVLLLLGITMFQFWGCGEDNNVEPVTPQTSILIVVKSAADSSIISGANVVLYNADRGEPVTRVLSGNDGIAKFENVLAGNFFIRISAQGFNELPQETVSPVPFSVTDGQTFTQTNFMSVLAGTFGAIFGTIEPKQPGFLIVATSAGMNAEYHTYSGPDGYFVLFNVPYESYVIDAIKAGYQSDNQPQVVLNSSSPSTTIQISSSQVTGSSLSGKVTFLAAQNGVVNISILDKMSQSVISGLSSRIDTSKSYSISNIPSGEYIAWASYENDGYVMDPDWIFKNPGALYVSFTNSSSKVRDFSVTGAINILSPSNSSSEIIPAVVDTLIPTFHWDAFPQTKEYIIEVKDINGNIIWGGFNESGEISHAPIPKEWTSVQFDFDGSATESLKSGNIYQWKLYSDDSASPGIQTLLSSSEDLMGLFIVK